MLLNVIIYKQENNNQGISKLLTFMVAAINILVQNSIKQTFSFFFFALANLAYSQII